MTRKAALLFVTLLLPLMGAAQKEFTLEQPATAPERTTPDRGHAIWYCDRIQSATARERTSPDRGHA